MTLADKAAGKDNNLNLIRFLAAMAVLFSHAFALVLGDYRLEPLRTGLGMSPGDIGVDLFFLASGFLVSGSLFHRKSLLDYLCARFLRIYPALIVMLLLCVFVVGPWFGVLPFAEFLRMPGTRRFLVENLILVRGAEIGLPGVFHLLPWRDVVNGSLWTMTYEIRLYLILGFSWALLGLVKVRRRKVFAAFVALSALVCLGFHLDVVRRDALDPYPRLYYMFTVGVLFQIWKERVVLSWPIFLAAVGLLACCLANRTVWQVAYPFLIPYAMFFVAYVPGGFLRAFNRVGDCSYGLYIYSFPIQQIWVALNPGIGVGALIAGSSITVLPIAMLSWHFLERRALGLKEAGGAKLRLLALRVKTRVRA
jgi:peptidoglycan/LPS O-acetylase OafA/YrhL